MNQVPEQSGPKVLFAMWRQLALPEFAAYTTEPWALPEMWINRDSLSTLGGLPPNLHALVRSAVKSDICRAVGIRDCTMDGIPTGVVTFRLNPDREDQFVALLRELASQPQQESGSRKLIWAIAARPRPTEQPRPDYNDIVAKLLQTILFKARPDPYA